VIHDSGGHDTFLQLENASAAPAKIRVGGRSTHLTVTVDAGKTGFLGPFDATPYVDVDGDLPIDFEGFEGIVRACQAPRV
jgi:hypothetical protein